MAAARTQFDPAESGDAGVGAASVPGMDFLSSSAKIFPLLLAGTLLACAAFVGQADAAPTRSRTAVTTHAGQQFVASARVRTKAPRRFCLSIRETSRGSVVGRASRCKRSRGLTALKYLSRRAGSTLRLSLAGRGRVLSLKLTTSGRLPQTTPTAPTPPAPRRGSLRSVPTPSGCCRRALRGRSRAF